MKQVALQVTSEKVGNLAFLVTGRIAQTLLNLAAGPMPLFTGWDADQNHPSGNPARSSATPRNRWSYFENAGRSKPDLRAWQDHRRLRHPLIPSRMARFIMRHFCCLHRCGGLIYRRINYALQRNAGAVPACGCRFIDRPATHRLAFLSRSRLLQHCRSGVRTNVLNATDHHGASLFARMQSGNATSAGGIHPYR